MAREDILLALERGETGRVDELLKSLVDPDIHSGEDFLLHLAGLSSNVDPIECLLKCDQNIDINVQDKISGCTALHLSAKSGNSDVVQLLLTKGAIVDARDKQGNTALSLACEDGRAECARVLLENEASVVAKNVWGHTPLHRVAHYGNIDCAKLLLNYGAPIDDKNDFGYTPLHRACDFGKMDCVRLLLERGANVALVTSSGLKPKECAAERKHWDIVSLLDEFILQAQSKRECISALKAENLDGFKKIPPDLESLVDSDSSNYSLVNISISEVPSDNSSANDVSDNTSISEVADIYNSSISDKNNSSTSEASNIISFCEVQDGNSPTKEVPDNTCKSDVLNSNLIVEVQSERSTLKIKDLILPVTAISDVAHVPIGEGGFGTVYKAHHPHWGPIAIKRPKVDSKLIASRSQNKMLLEIESQANLRHPNILLIIGVVWEPDFHAIVMEYLEYGDLSEFLIKYPEVEPWTKVNFLCEISSALGYMHSLKPKCIIHGDLKATNVFIGKNLVAKVGDFGLAQWATYVTQMTRRHGNTSRAGHGGGGGKSLGATFTHLCPESFADVHATPTVKFDVYSFAVLIWELFSGGLQPFEGCHPQRIYLAVVVNGQRPDEMALSADMPEFLRTLMRSCWAQQSDCRPYFKEILNKLSSLIDENKSFVDSSMAHLRTRMLHSSITTNHSII